MSTGNIATGTRVVSEQPASAGRETLLNRRGAEPLAVILFFSLLTLAMTWPWPLYLTDSLRPLAGDVALQFTVLRWDAHALTTNPLGLFEAPFFYPYAHSVAFSEHLIGETIIALPLLLLTGNPALAFNVNTLLSFVLTGLFTYLLVRDLTGCRAAALLAGVAFAFCPFRFMQIDHQHMLATQWFPFTLWSLGKWLGTGDYERTTTTDRASLHTQPSALAPRWLAWTAFGVIATGLSSVYYTLFLLVVLLLFAVWWLALGPGLRERRQIAWRRVLAQLLVAGVVVCLVLLPVLLPYAQTSSDLGLSRSVYELDNWSAEWSFFGNVTKGNWLYAHVLAPGMATSSGERQLFPGLVPTILALVGIGWGRGRQRFFFLLLGLLSLAMTFGLSRTLPGTSIDIPLPYAFFYNWVPGFQALRVPVRFSVLVAFSIYVLAGYGLARLVVGPRGAGAELGRRSPVLWALLAIALVLLEFANPLDAGGRRNVMAQLDTIEPYGWLAQPENAGPVVELPMSADQPDVSYMLFGTRDWQPLVDGWSGFVPPGTVYLKQALDSFPDPLTIALLQGLEVKHVVVHLWQFPSDRQASLKSRLERAPQLHLAFQAGENYVYTLAADPWLRAIARHVGDRTLWIGETRQGSMPTLEVLAYALEQWGVPRSHIGGNINIGYRPIGSLPFGTAPDYAFVPDLSANNLPFGFEDMQAVESNPAGLLLKRDPSLLASYDLTQSGPPGNNPLRMTVGASAISFDGSSGKAGGKRSLDIAFVAFGPSVIEIRAGGQAQTLDLPPGASQYAVTALDTPQQVEVTPRSGNARVLRVDLRSSTAAVNPNGLVPRPDVMPLQLDSTEGQGTFDTHLRVVASQMAEDHYTVTLDAYVQPWGTHPQGHFGSWSVVLPADGQAHDLILKLDPIAKIVTCALDGKTAETFVGFVGEPIEGGFKASLTILNNQGMLASMPTYTFTRKGSRITDWQPEPTLFSILRP